MIKLERPSCPEELTEERKNELLQRYKSNRSTVWKQSYISKKLLEMSYSKCAYCECRVNEESKYMEIDHFYPKSKYEDMVIEWTNLLPACKRCNGSSKRDHDPGEKPIIDPTITDPKNHLKMRTYRLIGKDGDQLGSTTVKVLRLNDQDKLVLKRKRIGDQLAQDLADLYEEITYRRQQLSEDQIFSNKICRKVTAFLKQALPQSEYAATSATILLNNVHFLEVKGIMQVEGIWSDDLENLSQQAEQLKLELIPPIERPH